MNSNKYTPTSVSQCRMLPITEAEYLKRLVIERRFGSEVVTEHIHSSDRLSYYVDMKTGYTRTKRGNGIFGNRYR